MEKNPEFVAIVAVSADGKIAPTKNYTTNWTSKEDKDFLHSELDSADLVIVGRKTFELAQKPLSKRRCLVFSRSRTLSENPNIEFINPQNIDLRSLAKQRKYKKVAILGGEQVYTLCLRKGWIDNIYLTVEPIIFGKGLSIFNLSGSFAEIKLRLLFIDKLNSHGSLIVKYKLLS